MEKLDEFDQSGQSKNYISLDQAVLRAREYAKEEETDILTRVGWDEIVWEENEKHHNEDSYRVVLRFRRPIHGFKEEETGHKEFIFDLLGNLLYQPQVLTWPQTVLPPQRESMGHNSYQRLGVIQGDITQQRVDAIVNAANSRLSGGKPRSVDGAIHRAAGPNLLQECRKLGGCEVGEAKITRGYNLPAEWVIHTVGPVWSGGSQGEAALLASCYRRCLALAQEYNLHTIAFPAISTGVYRFPMELATRIAVREVSNFLKTESSQGDSSITRGTLERVTFVCFNQEADSAYTAAVLELADG